MGGTTGVMQPCIRAGPVFLAFCASERSFLGFSGPYVLGFRERSNTKLSLVVDTLFVTSAGTQSYLETQVERGRRI